VAIGVLLFSYLVEMLQYFHFVERIGLARNKLARTIIGYGFEWFDILAYTLGVATILILEILAKRTASRQKAAIRATTTILFFILLNNIFAQQKAVPLKISHLTGSFYVFTTYNLYKGNRIPANGMYLVTEKGVVMFDTPWDSTQFQPLLDSIEMKHHKNVIACIATHFHEDRTGGLEYYWQQGIKTYTTRQTDELSKKKGMKRAEFLIDKDTVFTIGHYSFQTYFPGEGHTRDNIIIWFENEKILYGGCLIKSVADENLGNLLDANVKQYEATIKNVEAKCKNPKYIIPGHGDWRSTKSLEHTLKMAEALNEKN
jgi:metallo-beta-lactamase class B